MNGGSSSLGRPSNIRNIPGFYYNEEKGKYFKIQPNHFATPSVTPYTKQAVREKREGSKRRRLDEKQRSRQRQQTIIRSRLRDPRLAGFLLNNRLGGLDKPLRPRTVANLADWYAASLQHFTYFPPCPKQLNRISSFVRDDQTGALILAIQGTSTRGGPNNGLEEWPIDAFYTEPDTINYEDMADDPQLWKISLSSKRFLLETSCRSTTSSGDIVIYRLRDPAISVNPDHTNCLSGDTYTTFGVSETSFWSHAPSPGGSKFLITADRGFCIARLDQGYSWKLELHLDGPEDECMTSEWQTENVYITGKRSGVVRFHDERVDTSTSRLYHPSAVTATKMIDESRILVRGLKQMSLYDLRFAKKPNLKRRKDYTIPCMEYPTFPGSDRFGLGFDYDPELKIFATATDLPPNIPLPTSSPKSNNSILLFDPYSPHPLPTPSSFRYQHDLEPITDLYFTPSISAFSPIFNYDPPSPYRTQHRHSIIDLTSYSSSQPDPESDASISTFTHRSPNLEPKDLLVGENFTGKHPKGHYISDEARGKEMSGAGIGVWSVVGKERNVGGGK